VSGFFVEKQLAELIGPALDWAVARAAGITVELAAPQYGAPWRPFLPDTGARFAPSANWEQAGPLLEAHKIGSGAVGQGWVAYPRRSNAPTDWLHAPSALVAICRAVVADKLGLVVGIPAELAQ
jgi:hypothetical protein